MIVIVESVASDWLNPSEVLATEYLIIIGVLALVFSLMLLLTPKAIFSLERQANRVYMTDPTFMKYRVPFGLFLLVSGAFMIYSTIGYF